MWLGRRLKEICARQTNQVANSLYGYGFGKVQQRCRQVMGKGNKFMETEAVEMDEDEEQLRPLSFLCTETRSSSQATVVTDKKQGF